MTTITAPRTVASAQEAWPLLRELSPATSQRVFRAIMDAVARPGTVQQLPLEELPAEAPAALLPLLALADIMTPIGALRSRSADAAVLPSAAMPPGTVSTTAAIERIGGIVGAPVVQAAAARYALALGESDDLAELSPGTHWSPETGATLVQRVTAIVTEDVSHGWRLTGPGIPEPAPVDVFVAGVGERFVAARAELVSDYPTGVDSILITDEGTLMALPRTTRIEVI